MGNHNDISMNSNLEVVSRKEIMGLEGIQINR